MKIGIDIRPLMSSARSGVGQYSYELLNAVFALDKTNQYFLFYNSHKDVSQNIPQWPQANIQYLKTRWPNKAFNASIKFFSSPKIDRLIKNEGLDYFFSSNFNFTTLTKETKYILTVHDLSFEFFPQFYSLKQRLWHKAINPQMQCERADLILAPSENTKRDLINFYKINSGKIKVIYPGISCHSKQSEESLSDKKLELKQKYNLPEKFILFLGTIEPRKNTIGLIEAFERFSSQTPFSNFSLVIAGHKGWNDTQIYKKFQSSPYKEKIKFIGSIESDDKVALYSLATIFVYPSFYEGFGFPIVEAMAAGTPIITSNRSSLPEVAGSAAYLVNPNRPSELANAMIEMFKNQKLRDHFRSLGLEQVKKFSWEKAAKEFLNIFL